MQNDLKQLLLVFIICASTVISFLIGFTAGSKVERLNNYTNVGEERRKEERESDRVRIEAVTHGYAKYELDRYGHVQFKWIEPKNKE